ncbi:MAG TPA: phosphoglucosamine mutase [Rhodospirillales bacterium]|jgi:phosphoglucosamine mutase|nr:phosphoglucosamine mutase [Rhodospirillales bacterium]HIL75922.1 phosphoglucosamine mutase [Rhodospirillales bacterium]
MIRKIFGTDGIRGTANIEPMTAETALKVGMAAGLHAIRGNYRHRVVIGKDTRLSGYLIEPALTAGFVAVGMDPILVGPIPTPAVAMLTRSLRADLGVMISASHNPFQDNGIKLFGPDGYKLSESAELGIETRIEGKMTTELAKPEQLGKALRLEDAQGRYIEFVKQTFPRGLTLDGLKVVMDCANGAAYKVAPTVLMELGAEVIPLGVDPDGYNINSSCGSTSTELMQAQVAVHGADIGIALDGDADRVLISNEIGEMVDGDQIMGLIADYWSREGKLTGGVVATVMSNLGFERFIKGLNLALIRTDVGDRYVMEQMRTNNFNLGGEQSGHIVLSDYSTTGDGLIAVLQVLAVIQRVQRPVSEVCNVFEPVPQLIRNIKIEKSAKWETDRVKKAIAAGENKLKDIGRILVRISGTEPLVRIMAEGNDYAVISQIVDDITFEIEQNVRP